MQTMNWGVIQNSKCCQGKITYQTQALNRILESPKVYIPEKLEKIQSSYHGVAVFLYPAVCDLAYFHHDENPWFQSMTCLGFSRHVWPS